MSKEEYIDNIVKSITLDVQRKNFLTYKEQYGWKDYITDVIDRIVQQENQSLKKQLEELKSTNKVLSEKLTKDKILKQDCLTTCCGIPIGDIPKLINQQKKFIEYLEDEFTKIQNDIEKEIDNNVKYFKVERRQIITEILQKYKEIIGVSDENNKQ